MRRNDTNGFRDDDRPFRETDGRIQDHERAEKPAAIEADIRRTRTAMDETLDELARRLEPGKLIGEVWSAVRGQVPGKSGAAGLAKDAGAGLASRIAAHPLPSALIGAGLVWLIAEEASGASTKPSDIGHAAGNAGRHAGEGIGQGIGNAGRRAGHGIADAGRQAGHAVADTGRHVAGSAAHAAEWSMHAAADAAREVGDRTMQGVSATSSRTARAASAAARNVSDHTTHAFERYPAGFTIAALGAGLIAGMAMPNTRRENRWMGSTAGRLRRQAADVAQEAAADAIETGSERVAAAAESAGEKLEDKSREGHGGEQGQHDHERREQSPHSQVEPRH